MSLTIWKFSLPVTDDAVVPMPEGAHVLTVATQDAQPFLWAIVNPSAPTEMRRFAVRGTGHGVGEVGEYIGTFQMLGGDLVFHVFDAAPRP